MQNFEHLGGIPTKGYASFGFSSSCALPPVGFSSSSSCPLERDRGNTSGDLVPLNFEALPQNGMSVEMSGNKNIVIDGAIRKPYDTEKRRKGECHMSLIVTMINRNGIAMAADSKSTVYDCTGYPETDVEHPERKKIFLTKNFILGAIGANMIVQKDQGVILIEEILDQFLKAEPGMEEFKERIPQKLRLQANGSAEFIIGYKRNGIYQCDSVVVSSGHANVSKSFMRKALVSSGRIRLVPDGIPIRDEWDLKKMEQICKKCVENAISLGDACLLYNPVGGNVRTEVFC